METTQNANRCLADFQGAWTLDRVITHADGRVDRLTGEAVWRPNARGGLTCTETGTLRLAQGGSFAAERRYDWDASLGVWFADGRFFHAVPARGGWAEHLCGADLYRAEYRFAAWPNWACVWHVDGPAKAYRMYSAYARKAG